MTDITFLMEEERDWYLYKFPPNVEQYKVRNSL